jgi:hypothetical protein
MATAEVKFFTARREMEIGDFHSLKTRGGERRVKTSLRIPLSNRPTQGIPDWVLEGYTFVVKDASPYDKTSCKGVKLEGMSIAFYTSDTVKRKMQGVGGLNGCTMDRFVVERVGEGEKAEVYINFIVYAPCSKDIIAWFYDHQGASIFCEFDTTQASFAYEGEEEDEDGEDEGDNESQGDMDFEASDEDEEVTGDPNDNPKEPIPFDSRKVTLPSDKPAKRSHHKKK